MVAVAAEARVPPPAFVTLCDSMPRVHDLYRIAYGFSQLTVPVCTLILVIFLIYEQLSQPSA